MLLYDKWVNEEIKEKTTTTTKIPEKNETFQNLWEAVKGVLRGKSIVIHAYLRKQEKSQRRANKAQSQQKEINNKDQRGNN